MAPSIYSIRLDDVIIDCPEQGRKQFILFFYCVLSVVCVCAFVRHYVLLHLGRVREDQAERTLRMYGREQ